MDIAVGQRRKKKKIAKSHHAIRYLFLAGRLMEASMDIAICLDCTSSVASTFCQVRDRISAIIAPAVRNRSDIRLALIEFRSRDDSWVTIIHPFTHSASTFHHWLNNARAEGGSQDGTRAISKHSELSESNAFLRFEAMHCTRFSSWIGDRT